jgi:hypothetical protein
MTDRTTPLLDQIETDADGWPVQFDRTPEKERERTSRRNTPHPTQTRDEIRRELRKLGAENSEILHTDPGAVVTWLMGGEQYLLGCDSSKTIKGCLRQLLLYIQEVRLAENRHVKASTTLFSAAKIEPPTDDEPSVIESSVTGGLPES